MRIDIDRELSMTVILGMAVYSGTHNSPIIGAALIILLVLCSISDYTDKKKDKP